MQQSAGWVSAKRVTHRPMFLDVKMAGYGEGAFALRASADKRA
jgi:hypothetical protein